MILRSSRPKIYALALALAAAATHPGTAAAQSPHPIEVALQYLIDVHDLDGRMTAVAVDTTLTPWTREYGLTEADLRAAAAATSAHTGAMDMIVCDPAVRRGHHSTAGCTGSAGTEYLLGIWFIQEEGRELMIGTAIRQFRPAVDGGQPSIGCEARELILGRGTDGEWRVDAVTDRRQSGCLSL